MAFLLYSLKIKAFLSLVQREILTRDYSSKRGWFGDVNCAFYLEIESAPFC
jgi:hypothetical protein